MFYFACGVAFGVISVLAAIILGAFFAVGAASDRLGNDELNGTDRVHDGAIL